MPPATSSSPGVGGRIWKEASGRFPGSQRRRAGLGRALVERAERAMAAMGAKRIYIETSGRELYAPTRAFYRAVGYRKAAAVADFYGEGDAKVIYARTVPV